VNNEEQYGVYGDTLTLTGTATVYYEYATPLEPVEIPFTGNLLQESITTFEQGNDNFATSYTINLISGVDDANTNYYYSSNNNYLYNIPEIFSGYSLPTLSEFLILRDFYDLYDGKPVDITYNDIFSDNYSLYGDNFELYDLTTPFGSDLEPSIAVIAELFDIWFGTYGIAYSDYYPAAALTTLMVSYEYDDTPLPPPDFIGGVTDGLDNMGVLTPELKVILGVVIMIVFTIVVGKFFGSWSFIILGDIVLFMLFALLGWFSLWVLGLIALILIILIILKLVKGGS